MHTFQQNSDMFFDYNDIKEIELEQKKLTFFSENKFYDRKES